MKEARPVPEKLGEAECLRLISPGGAGRIAFAGSYDLTVLPVIYQLADGAILFRAAQDGLTEEDLRTGSSTASTGWRSRLTISTRRRGKAGASWSRDLLTISTPRMSRRQPGPRAWSHGRRRAQSLHPRHARPRPPAGGSGRAREPGRGASARASAGEARAVRQDWLRLAEPAGGYPAFDPAMRSGLPEPARRWLRHAIAPGTPLWRPAEPSVRGQIRLRRCGPSPPGRCWHRRTAPSGPLPRGWPGCR